MLASGDLLHIAQSIGQSLGLDQILGDLTPEEKVAVVRREATMRPVMMVGDGVNDAPALAAADVGVAMGARGAAASSEAAGVVLLVDELLPLTKALGIARRTRDHRPAKCFRGPRTIDRRHDGGRLWVFAARARRSVSGGHRCCGDCQCVAGLAVA